MQYVLFLYYKWYLHTFSKIPVLSLFLHMQMWKNSAKPIIRHTTFIKCTVSQGTFPLIVDKLLT